jgi:hypothetical protein
MALRILTRKKHGKLQGTRERDYGLNGLPTTGKLEVKAICFNLLMILLKIPAPNFCRLIIVLITQMHDNIPYGQVLDPVDDGDTHGSTRNNFIKGDNIGHGGWTMELDVTGLGRFTLFLVFYRQR